MMIKTPEFWIGFIVAFILFSIVPCAKAEGLVYYDIWGQNPSGTYLHNIDPDEYRFPNDALSASTVSIPNAGLLPYAQYADFILNWECENTENSLELVIADNGPSNIQRLAEFHCDGYVHPQKLYVNITNAWNAMIDRGGYRQIGIRFKGLEWTMPRIFTARIEVIEE